jgi:hypothetical protein
MRKVRFVSVIWLVLLINNIYGFDKLPTSVNFSRQKPQKHLINCPASSEHIKPFSKAAYEMRAKEYAINNIASETFSDNIEPIQTGLNIIDISSNITTNTIWTSDNIYHVLNAIDVNGAMLVIEPGTTVTFAGGGSSAGIKVLNGGTLIARGTPDEPILFTSDSSSPYYDDYYYAAYIEETASTATQFTYCIVEWAYAGIALFNIDLDTNIENNYFMACVWGITEHGPKHTDIINNLCFGSRYCGIYVNMKSLLDVSDADSIVKIQNNTCDYYQECGIIVYGADDFDTAGSVELKNNIVSEASDYGISLWDCLYVTANNNGYYNNYSNTNGFPEYDPVEVFEMPYVYGPGDYDICYLNQNCAFIDGGLHYVEEMGLIGKTTAVDGVPDSNKIDIGFHYPNWDYSNAGSTTLQADFDNNYKVDYKDLAFFADFWLFDYNEAYEVLYWDYEPDGRIDFMDLAYLLDYWPDYFNFEDFADFARQWRKKVDDRLYDGRADLNKDDIVNFEDFAILAGEWGMTGDAELNIIPVISGDPNYGYMEVGAVGFTGDTQKIFLLVDGEYMREIFGFRNGKTLGIDISKFSGQEKQFKLVGLSKTGRITCSNITNMTFSCPLNYCFLPGTYEPNKPLFFAAHNPSLEDLTVKVYANGGNLVWSQTYSGNSIFGSIPAEVTNQYEFDYTSFDKSGGVSILKVTDPALNLSSSAGDIKALIVLPDILIRIGDIPTISVVETAFKNNGVNYQKLSLASATWDNIAWFAQNRNIKYIYVNSHGHYIADEGGTSRTTVKLWDGWTVSVKQSDFLPGGAPLWCTKLEGNLENTAKSFATMGFTSLEFAYFDCCWSGHLMINSYNMLVSGAEGQQGVVYDTPYSDMTLALGIDSPGKSRFYQGWYGESPFRCWWTIWYLLFGPTEYQKWTRLEWQKLGEGYRLDQALNYVVSEQTEFGQYDPVNNYRLKGHGFLLDIRLNGN